MTHKTKITVYTTNACPYCVSAKQLLESRGHEYSEVDVSKAELRTMLVKKAQGRKTVPQIFIGDLHVGGFDDLNAMDKTGELEALLAPDSEATSEVV